MEREVTSEEVVYPEIIISENKEESERSSRMFIQYSDNHEETHPAAITTKDENQSTIMITIKENNNEMLNPDKINEDVNLYNQ